MLMPLLTPAAGKINFQLPEGAVLMAGNLIAVLDLDDPGAVTAASPYPGSFPELGPPLVHSQGVDFRFKEAYSAAKMILEGMSWPSLTLGCQGVGSGWWGQWPSRGIRTERSQTMAGECNGVTRCSVGGWLCWHMHWRTSPHCWQAVSAHHLHSPSLFSQM